MIDSDTRLDGLIHDLLARVMVLNPDRRLVVALAGIPGSGKSTLADAICHRLNQPGPDGPDHSHVKQGGLARVVPMDGFHLPDETLVAMGIRKRKGSPESFDLPAFASLVSRLGEITPSPLVFPVYDRKLHAAVLRDEPAQRLDADCRVVIVEGNYVLLDEPGWRDLSQWWDLRLFLDVPVEQARADVIARHVRGGKSVEQAQEQYAGNDLLNVRRILDRRLAVDRVLNRSTQAGE